MPPKSVSTRRELRADPSSLPELWNRQSQAPNHGWIRIRLHTIFEFLFLCGASLVPTGDRGGANSLIPRLLLPEIPTGAPPHPLEYF